MVAMLHWIGLRSPRPCPHDTQCAQGKSNRGTCHHMTDFPIGFALDTFYHMATFLNGTKKPGPKPRARAFISLKPGPGPSQWGPAIPIERDRKSTRLNSS